ncbi:MAG: IS3 family transposase [bacterium]
MKVAFLKENINSQLSFQKKCQLLNFNRNTAYYQLNDSRSEEKEAEDLEIKEEIDKIQIEFPYYGYRPVTAELRRQDRLINRKRVQRIMKKYGLLSQIRKLFKSFTYSRHKLPKYPNLIKNLAIITINQVWGADITYIRLKKEFVYLAVIIDFYSRKIKGWALSRNLDASLTIEALRKALTRNPRPIIHHSDQGVQYCDQEYVELLKENSILISMSDKGNPYQNNITESFFKTLKYNEVYLNDYEDFEEAYSNIENFIEIVYQKKRLHSSLGYLPPEEFEEKFLEQQEKQLVLEGWSKNDAPGCLRKAVSDSRRCLIPPLVARKI